jgi:uncharacterized protein (TIGR02996 family)
MRATKDVLSDICQHPERDDLRLEYADACEAKDPDYAQYIRAEIEWARPGRPAATQKGSKGVERRIAHPFEKYAYKTRLHRGFVEELTMDPYVFIERGGELFELAPIVSVTFTPRPVPPGIPMPLLPQRAPSAVPDVMACPHLRGLRDVAFASTSFQDWYLSEADLESVLASNYLDRLLTFALPGGRAPGRWPEGYSADLWNRAFERPEFRKMIDIDFPRYPGERTNEYEDGWERVMEPVAMDEQGRALERKHGYLPALHVINRWGDDPMSLPFNHEVILKVLRGTLPKFPAGARASEEMYELPNAKRWSIGNDW